MKRSKGKILESWVRREGRIFLDDDNNTLNPLRLFRFNDSHSFGGNVFRAPPPFDFMGLINTGLAIAIECKSTINKTYSISSLNEAQSCNLSSVDILGGLGLYVIKIDKYLCVIGIENIPDKGSIDPLKPCEGLFVSPWRGKPTLYSIIVELYSDKIKLKKKDKN